MKGWPHLKDPLFWLITAVAAFAVGRYVTFLPKTPMGEAIKHVTALCFGIGTAFGYRMLRRHLDDSDDDL